MQILEFWLTTLIALLGLLAAFWQAIVGKPLLPLFIGRTTPPPQTLVPPQSQAPPQSQTPPQPAFWPNILLYVLLTVIIGSAAAILLSNLGKLPSNVAVIGAVFEIVAVLIALIGSRFIFASARHVSVLLLSLVTVLSVVVYLLLTLPIVPVLPTLTEHLEDDYTRWTTIQGSTQQNTIVAKPTNVTDPIAGRSTIKISFNKAIPGKSILAYRNLDPANNATYFELNLSFYYPDATPIQAVTFSMDKWVNHQRWEWALQWQNVPGGGAKPSWRVWDGKDRMWLDIGVTQDLAVNMWHTFHLYGNISNGQTHYLGFNCDDVYAKLAQSFDPAPDPGTDKLAVSVELDGDFNRDSYDVYVKDVDLRWS
jgi:hypothetical protein